MSGPVPIKSPGPIVPIKDCAEIDPHRAHLRLNGKWCRGVAE